MFIIKRIDTMRSNKPADYEATAYPTISDVYDQLSKLGANEDSYKYDKEQFNDAQAGERILTAHDNQGAIYEVRQLAIYGYSGIEAWTIERIIKNLTGDATAIKFTLTFTNLHRKEV